ncbi:MAG TPA: hypothetical protein VEC08_00485 [Nitrososphaerales archaeon]|nr:hypothetical protein [Nitrososphaerales archaeon]
MKRSREGCRIRRNKCYTLRPSRDLSLFATATADFFLPDGSLRSFDSLSEKRAVFGFERFVLYKIQAGIVVQGQKPDWAIRLAPRQALFAGRVFECVEVSQSIEFFTGKSSGYLRRVKLKNTGTSLLTLRLVNVLDPTASQLGEGPMKWGALGVNAFNRGSHVAMDEISDLPGARVVGSLPPPKKLFMTTDKGRIRDLVNAGDLGDATAGMSGQVMIASLHEVDIAPSESKELTFVSIYNSAKLEEALSDFGRIQAGDYKPTRLQGSFIAASSPSLTDAAAWAVASLESARFETESLDLSESLKALSFVDKESAALVIDGVKRLLRKDGAVSHSMDWAEPGVLETSVLLQAVAAHLLLGRDKKLSRSTYPLVKKLGSFLMALTKEYTLKPSPALPQGWRRRLGRGYPSGEVPEVSLAACGGLVSAAQVARQVGKADDAGRFRERGEMLAEMVRKRLVDERGFLSLCLDTSGKLRGDETVDMAVAAYRHGFLPSAEQAAVHRLMEKDFETPYGPRTVPTSNRLYFNPSYGEGQLGGFWTRAALAHAIVCYRAGLAGIGSLGLEKAARLSLDDAVRLGWSPGEFPQWVDIEGREAHGERGDMVSAARLVEGLLEEELGLQYGTGTVSISPPASSSLKWVFAYNVWAGEATTVFVGRGGGKTRSFAACSRLEVAQGERFAKAELLDLGVRGTHAVSFYGPGQVICIGNSSSSAAKLTVGFPPKAPDLSKRLSTPLEEYDRAGESWTKVSALRVLPTMTFDASLGPGEWKAFRVSTA